MPDYVFADFTPHVYPETRDAAGRHVGLVRPGDIRPFDAAPDHRWREATDGDRAAHEDPGTGQQMTGTGHPADGTWSPEVSSDPGQEGAEVPQDGPQPAAPAVIPGT